MKPASIQCRRELVCVGDVGCCGAIACCGAVGCWNCPRRLDFNSLDFNSIEADGSSGAVAIDDEAGRGGSGAVAIAVSGAGCGRLSSIGSWTLDARGPSMIGGS